MSHWRWADSYAILVVKTLLGLIAVNALAWYSPGNAVPRRQTTQRIFDGVLGVVGLLAFAAWWNFGVFHGYGTWLHYHELFHYYIGSKYHAELGYTRLYDCVAAHEAEQGRAGQVSDRTIRNLRTGELEKGALGLSRSTRCADHFSRARWREFGEDVDWFRGHMSQRAWAGAQMDHGYNGTPLWSVMGAALADTHLDERRIESLAMLDNVLLIGMWAAVWITFGWRATCVGLIWWGLNFAGRYVYIGGAFLRDDWLVLSVAGVCLMKRGWSGAAGAALAASSLLRVFPALMLIGLAVKTVVQIIRRMPVPHAKRFFASALATSVTLTALSIITWNGSTAAGLDAWMEFAANSRKYLSTPTVNRIGLPAVLAYRLESRGEYMYDPSAQDSWGAWRESRRNTLQARRYWFTLGIIFFLIVLVRAALRHEDWVALILGTGFVTIAAYLPNYYAGSLLLYGCLWPRLRDIGLGLAVVTTAVCLVPLIWPGSDDQYAAIGMAMVIFVVWSTWHVGTRHAIGELTGAAKTRSATGLT